MNVIVSAAQMQALDRRTIEEAGVPGTTLMERAGAGVVACLQRQLGQLRGKTVTILCGKGNNGGDGFVVARLLHKQRAKVQVLTLAPATALSRDAATMYRRLVRAAGKAVLKPFSSASQVQALLEKSDVIIDALLGTGLASSVTDRYADAIESINQAQRLTLAVDLPSGIHADSGAVLGRAVKADLTVTFGLPKLGLFQNQGIDHAGRVEIVDIGIPQNYVDAMESRIHLISDSFVHSVLPPRRLSGHKGTFGHAGIIAGSVGKTGAAAMDYLQLTGYLCLAWSWAWMATASAAVALTSSWVRASAAAACLCCALASSICDFRKPKSNGSHDTNNPAALPHALSSDVLSSCGPEIEGKVDCGNSRPNRLFRVARFCCHNKSARGSKTVFADSMPASADCDCALAARIAG